MNRFWGFVLGLGVAVSAAQAYPLRVDSVENQKFLEHVWVNRAGHVVWAVYDNGSDMNYEPLRSACIRRQADEVRAWVSSFESSASGYYAVPALRALAKRVSMPNFVPSPHIAIEWNKYSYHDVTADPLRLQRAKQSRSYLWEWNGVSFNNVVLTVAPYPTPDFRNCDIVTRAELEQFFSLIYNCASVYGPNCRPLE